MSQSIIKTRGAYITGAVSVAGKHEMEGPLGDFFDIRDSSDLFGAETWEKAESEMQKLACKRLLKNLGTSDLLQQLFRVQKGDVVIGISFPRYSKQTNVAMKHASESGATVIAITDNDSSPIAEGATHVLTAGSDMVSFADSLVAPLSLINSIVVAVSLKKENEINQNFEKLESLWDEFDVYEKSDR